MSQYIDDKTGALTSKPTFGFSKLEVLVYFVTFVFACASIVLGRGINGGFYLKFVDSPVFELLYGALFVYSTILLVKNKRWLMLLLFYILFGFFSFINNPGGFGSIG